MDLERARQKHSEVTKASNDDKVEEEVTDVHVFGKKMDEYICVLPRRVPPACWMHG